MDALLTRPSHTLEYYTAANRDRPQVHAATWIDRTDMLLSDGHAQKSTHYLIHFYQEQDMCVCPISVTKQRGHAFGELELYREERAS